MTTKTQIGENNKKENTCVAREKKIKMLGDKYGDV